MDTLAHKLTPANLARLVEQAVPTIACELRPDVLAALRRAVATETSERGRLVLGQLVENARLAAEQRVPLCQDTGSVWVLLEVGESDAVGNKIAISSDIFSGLDKAVARAYRAAGLRMSLVRDALTDRSNTGDNTPAFCEIYLNPARRGALLHVMLKGGGSDNASRVVMLPPGAGIEGVRRTVLDAVREKGESACPPLIVGVGVGSTFDKVGGLAKRALLRSLGTPNPKPQLAALEQELFAGINALGIGPGGFGGDTTTLAVHVLSAPCHIAALPVAVNIGCNSLRSVTIDLDAEGEQ
ncbi:MAG: fumarate hydratase [Coriobacteriales bacterium]|jgi:tartrate/fumarate subfamily iron-sulfur-dependent hydro-lyase alpha chain|nr:fumarate hydratase [Coriobacteriales bacterium]